MKRTLIVMGLALVMVLGVAATAHAANPPGTYKLTVTCYYDTDADYCWDACEPILYPAYGVGELWVNGAFVGLWQTDKCGSYKTWLPAGSTVTSVFKGVGGEWQGIFPYGWMLTEITPTRPASPWFAKVVMNGNRCMLYGIAPVGPPD